MERKDGGDYLKACTRLVLEKKASIGRPRQTWQNTLSADMRLLKVDCRASTTERNGGPQDGLPGSVWNTALKQKIMIMMTAHISMHGCCTDSVELTY